MQYSLQYLMQAKNKLQVYFDSKVYCQNGPVDTAVKRYVSRNVSDN